MEQKFLDNEIGLPKLWELITNKFAKKTEIVNPPTKTSELENDSGYQTSQQVDSKISNAIVSIEAITAAEITSICQ